MTVRFAANATEGRSEREPTRSGARLSFIQTEVSRAEKIKRGKKISRIHLNLDGIIMVDDGGRREDYLDIYGAAGRGRGVEASEGEEHIFIKDLLLLRLCPKNNSVLLSILIT